MDNAHIVNRGHSFSEKENKWHEHPRYFTHYLCLLTLVVKLVKIFRTSFDIACNVMALI